MGVLGRAYGRLADRVGHTAAGAIVLALAGVLWLGLAWAVGDLR